MERIERPPHILRPRTRAALGDLRVYVDTETTVVAETERAQLQRLRFGWACVVQRRRYRDRDRIERRWLRFTTPGEFWDAVCAVLRPRSTCTVIAHNIDFDGAVLATVRELTARGFRLVETARGQHLLWLVFQNGTRRIRLLDSFNLYPMALQTIGEALGIPKLPMPAPDADAASWDAYCRRDVEILVSAVERFEEEMRTRFGVGIQLTLARQALAIYSRLSDGVRIHLHNDAQAIALERAAYFGGRCENTVVGRVPGPVYALDINSAYPAVMRDLLVPVELECVLGEVTPEELRSILQRRCVVAAVELRTERPCYPVRIGARTVYPVGRFSTVLTTPELVDAVMHGELLRVGPVAVYRRARAFARYVDVLYALRQERHAAGDAAGALIAKHLLNSLYGKFGQRGDIVEPCTELMGFEDAEVGLFDCDGEHWTEHVHIPSGWIHRLKRPVGYNAFPAIAAHITAAQRLRLWRFIERAGVEHVFYYDTDSLHVDTVGFERLSDMVDPQRLGWLKVTDVWPWVEYYAPKDYRTPMERKLKGVRPEAKELGRGVYEMELWRSYLVSLARYGDGVAVIERAAKHLQRTTQHRRPLPQGRTEPLRFDGTPSALRDVPAPQQGRFTAVR